MLYHYTRIVLIEEEDKISVELTSIYGILSITNNIYLWYTADQKEKNFERRSRQFS